MSAGFTDSLLALTDEAFIRTAYVTLLGRSADASGMRDYLDSLRTGSSRQQVWTEISASEEGRRHSANRQSRPGAAGVGQRKFSSVADLLTLEGVEFVSEAYRHVLGRKADVAGLRDYAARLASGVNKQQILADLRSDPEGQAFGSGLAGLDELVQAVQSSALGNVMRAGIGSAAPASLEELSALDGKEFVHSAYSMLFGRDADADGLARYCPLLLQGFSKLFVLDALYTSPEARDKNARLPGLDQRLREYRKAQRPGWGGWYWRHVRGIESDLPRDRETRAVLARLYSR